MTVLRQGVARQTRIQETNLPKTIISDANAKDVAALAALSEYTFKDAFGPLFQPDNLTALVDQKHSVPFYEAALADPNMKPLVARSGDGALVGYALCGPVAVPVADAPAGALELHRIYMDPDVQSKGLGQQLLDACFEWPPFAAAPAIYLSVFSGNVAAHRFYRRNGFEKVGEYESAVGTDRDHEFIFARLAK